MAERLLLNKGADTPGFTTRADLGVDSFSHGRDDGHVRPNTSLLSVKGAAQHDESYY